MISEVRTRLVRFVLVLVGITALGTAGFVLIEGWRVADASYMTVITLSTVGYGEVRPLSEAGRLFTTGLIMAGVGSVAYLFSAVGRAIVSGEISGSWRSKRMQQRIDALHDHYIVCGLGRVGHQVAADLERRDLPTVAVESAGQVIDEIATDILYVAGDAKDDETLQRAGIERARGLVATTGDDADNLFITVTARALNPSVTIIARANQPTTEPRFLRAGADHVISPYTITGHRIATQLLHPSVTAFLDLAIHSGKLELWLEECLVEPDGGLHNKTVAEAQVRQPTGANVLAVHRRGDDEVLTNPPVDTRLEPGDVMIAVGTQTQLQALRELAARS